MATKKKKHTASRAKRNAAKKTVYVVGAGFSAGLGYPLVNDLLIRLWSRIPDDEREKLAKVIGFHHPGFKPSRASSFPNIETLLSEMAANEQLFRASRRAPTGFKSSTLRDIKDRLLYAISNWFHDIYEQQSEKTPSWVSKFGQRVRHANATVISFNWDLVLDHLLFGDEILPENYGLADSTIARPLLLKPHGSLNWYDEKQGENIKEIKRIELHAGNRDKVYAFTQFREPHSKFDRRYSPLIVPPVFNKDFEKEIFTPLWRKCVDELSVAHRVIFLGYSLPDADLQARFILRCGFHNQQEGLPTAGGRASPIGQCEVTIVNPDVSAARRIESILPQNCPCDWQPFTVENWLKGASV